MDEIASVIIQSITVEKTSNLFETTSAYIPFSYSSCSQINGNPETKDVVFRMYAHRTNESIPLTLILCKCKLK